MTIEPLALPGVYYIDPYRCTAPLMNEKGVPLFYLLTMTIFA
jgi:hypothetical protein